MSYDPKHELVRARQLKTARLAIPVFITGNATPASKSIAYDEPALVFLKTEGLDHITLARGAVDSAAELSAITFATATDATGIFSALVRLNEQIAKVCSVKLVKRNGNEQVVGTPPTGASSYITSAGDKIVANFDCAVDFSAANGDFALEVEYVVSL
jgi:hypothetical protein